MTSSAIIDTAVGLVLVFAIFSAAVSRVNEWIANLFKLRFKMLVRGLEHMLSTGDQLHVTGPTALFTGRKVAAKTPTEPSLTTNSLLASEAVKRSSVGHPSYLAPRTFALGILEVLDTGGAVDNTLTGIDTAVNELPSELRLVLQPMLRRAEGSRTKFIAELEHWYNATMDRVSGLYKRMIQWVLIGIALIVVVACNVDTIHIADTLYRNPAVRQIAVQEATTTSPQLCPLKSKETTGTTSASGSGAVSADNAASCLVKKTQDLQLPLFWGKDNRPSADGGWLLKGLGLLVSLLALSFGATFWFDLLGNLVNLRNAGAKPTPATSPPPTVEVALTVTAAPAPTPTPAPTPKDGTRASDPAP